MKQSPLTQLERLPATEGTLAQLMKLHTQLVEKETKSGAVDRVEFVLVPSVWRKHWIPPENEL